MEQNNQINLDAVRKTLFEIVTSPNSDPKDQVQAARVLLADASGRSSYHTPNPAFLQDLTAALTGNPDLTAAETLTVAPGNLVNQTIREHLPELASLRPDGSFTLTDVKDLLARELPSIERLNDKAIPRFVRSLGYRVKPKWKEYINGKQYNRVLFLPGG